MSIASIVTRGFIDGVNFIPTRGYSSSSAPTPSVITGGHFLPAGGKHKRRTLSNVQVIFEKAKDLPRKETKELRDAIAGFVDPAIARKVVVPDTSKLNYELLQDNEIAYQKFAKALENLEQHLGIKIKEQEDEDEELLLLATIACLIH